ncbi:N-6 DNA methylase [Streptosporangiaceae bacterium NEAU-GS5]|nr:N-6 DNA methylase [Streptosporangiaceae bacterium NEAU-GS5]
MRVTVNAGDIARLADVGRAAVSNWRRRYEDFPRPVGGTASSPLFSLTEVEDWLRRNGKAYTLSLGDRVWQRLRAAGGDLRLGDLVAAAGEHLAGRTSGLDAELVRLLDQYAAADGARAAYEFLCERYAEAHSRRLDITPPEIAALMARLAPGRTVLDPACGVGTLLLAAADAGATLGQELDAATARIAAARLTLSGVDTRVKPGNSLRADAFPAALPGNSADAVLCHPPFNERAWGHEELTGDARWAYGVPPRGEPELAWVQHCLAHVRPGGLVAILMPSAAAGRRAGRRIRGNLLRAGALRAVITLSTVPAGGLDLWLLRGPERGERPPAGVLIMDASGDLAAIEPAWRGYLAGAPVPGVVPVVGLLDDEVDIGPARHRPSGEADLGLAFAAAAARLNTVSFDVPDLSAEPFEVETTTLAELARTGAVEVIYGRPRPETDDSATLTAEDLLNGGYPEPVKEAVVVASPVLGIARVVEAAGLILGPQLTLFRVDPDRLDPYFLAGCLRAGSGRGGRVSQVSSRIDARRTRIPRLPVETQRAYGVAFQQLASLEDALRTAADAGEEIIRLGVEGLAGGHLRPPG